MEVTLEKKSNTKGLITVSVKESDYKEDFDKQLKAYGKKVTLKGFRPGQVPAEMINKMYGKTIKFEIISKIVDKALADYIQKSDLKIIGQPLPEESQNPINWTSNELALNYEIGMIPAFNYNSDQEFTQYVIEVSDEAVSKTVENLKSQFGTSINPEFSAKGDFIGGNLKGQNGTYDSFTLIPTNRIAESEIAAFEGLKVGDTLTFDLRKAFADDNIYIAHALGISKDEAPNYNGNFVLTIEKITRQEIASMNQELYTKVFGTDEINTEEAFLTKLKSTIEDNYSRETTNLFRFILRKNIVNNTQMDIPEEFFKRWLLLNNKGNEKLSAENIEKDIALYVEDLKWMLIRDQIASECDIKVEANEVIQKAKDQFIQQMGGMTITPEMNEKLNEWARNYIKEDKDNYEKLFYEVLSEKSFYALENKVIKKSQIVTEEEFRTIAETYYK